MSSSKLGERATLRLVRVTAPSSTGEKPPASREDAYVSKAIELMQASPATHWTVSALARKVGLSRPAFARRFVEGTGSSPMRYLTHHRMVLSSEVLLGSDWPLAAVARHVGYSSEFAFNRAFKRHHGISPGTFRRQVASTSKPTLCLAA